MTKRKRRKFTPQQKADAVRLVRQVGSISEVARDLDLSPSVLHNWVKQAERDALVGKVPVPLFRRYEMIRKRKGTAIAATSDGEIMAGNIASIP